MVDLMKPQGRTAWIGWAIGAVAVVLVGLLIVLAFTGNRGGTAAPVPSTPVTSQSVQTPPGTAAPTGDPTATMSPSQIEAYCADYKAILGSGTDSDTDDDSGADFERLSALYADLIVKYTAASKNAPANLASQFSEVIQYLTDAKATVETRDLDAIRAQMRLLSKLNASMEAIEKASNALCG